MLEEKMLILFLKKFDESSFLVKVKKHEYKIGKGASEFVVKINGEIPISELTTNTFLALRDLYAGRFRY